MSQTHPPLDQTQREVEEMVLDGRPFPRVEHLIDSTSFGDEDKAALWLYAWSLEERLKRGPATTPSRGELTSV